VAVIAASIESVAPGELVGALVEFDLVGGPQLEAIRLRRVEVH
jgi:hypothetical protein